MLIIWFFFSLTSMLHLLYFTKIHLNKNFYNHIELELLIPFFLIFALGPVGTILTPIFIWGLVDYTQQIDIIWKSSNLDYETPVQNII